MVKSTELPDWHNKTILIAEDIDSNYAVVSALLKHTHVKIIRAHNGAEAIDMVTQQHDIDLVLMDISMPDTDGIEALRLIRQQIPDKIKKNQIKNSPPPGGRGFK